MEFSCGCIVEIDAVAGAGMKLCPRHMNYAEAIGEALAEEHGACRAKPLPESNPHDPAAPCTPRVAVIASLSRRGWHGTVHGSVFLYRPGDA
jgi:hypothetical protein